MSRRVALGRWANGVGSGFGLRTSLPGKSALSSDDRNLSFSSDWVLQTPILLRGVASLSGGQRGVDRLPQPGLHAPGAVPGPGGRAAVRLLPGPQQRLCAYQNSADNDTSYVLMQAFADHLALKYQLYKVNNDTRGWPNGVNVAYVVYKIPAFY